MQACGLQVHLVVREHEAHAFVRAQGFAKGLTMTGVLQRDVMRTSRLAQPAHAVRQSSRSKAHLGIAEAFVQLA